MNPFAQLIDYRVRPVQMPREPKPRKPAKADKPRAMTTRVLEYVTANPGSTAYQVEQALNLDWKSANMTLNHLQKIMGKLIAKRKFTDQANGRMNFVKHYWSAE